MKNNIELEEIIRFLQQDIQVIKNTLHKVTSNKSSAEVELLKVKNERDKYKAYFLSMKKKYTELLAKTNEGERSSEQSE